jgi:8-oxo-dGTP pyrophosphatase MutT (NUDIX family)
MSKERFKFISAVHLLFIRNNKILLSKRMNTGWEDGKYSVIAGHVDGNEKVIDTMIREAKEEAGFQLNENDLKFVHIMHRKSGDGERMDFFFELKDYPVEPENKEPKKCEELKWFDVNNLPENMVEYVRRAIELTRKGISYSEFDFE